MNKYTISPSKNRELSFDLLKCFAIFLVIWQHSIYSFGYGIEMLTTPIGKFISMINMPLFMFIVGYFSKSSIQRPFRQMVKNKWDTLLMPMLVYCAIQSIVELCLGTFTLPLYKHLILSIIRPYWFIWALLYSILWYRLFRYLLPKYNTLIISTISLMVAMLIPRGIPVPPHFAAFQSMYPFFLIGLISKEYNLLNKLKLSKWNSTIMFCSLIVFLILYFLYDKENFFYFFILISTPKWIESYLMMLIAGTTGILICYMAAELLARKNTAVIKWTAEIGKYTFAIYMMQGVLCKIAEYLKYGIYNQFVLFGIALIVFFALSESILYLR